MIQLLATGSDTFMWISVVSVLSVIPVVVGVQLQFMLLAQLIVAFRFPRGTFVFSLFCQCLRIWSFWINIETASVVLLVNECVFDVIVLAGFSHLLSIHVTTEGALKSLIRSLRKYGKKTFSKSHHQHHRVATSCHGCLVVGFAVEENS